MKSEVYNRLCARFVGEEQTLELVDAQMDLEGNSDLRFDTDWNWIELVREKVCDLPNVRLLDMGGTNVSVRVIDGQGNPLFESISRLQSHVKEHRAAVVHAIGQFLDWHFFMEWVHENYRFDRRLDEKDYWVKDNNGQEMPCGTTEDLRVIYDNAIKF